MARAVDRTDPVVIHTRREGLAIFALWLSCLVYCCTYCYLHGYSRPDRPLGEADLHFIAGIPSWVVWGIFAPWAACSVLSITIAAFVMKDDDLGTDRAEQLESEIHKHAQAEGSRDE